MKLTIHNLVPDAQFEKGDTWSNIEYSTTEHYYGKRSHLIGTGATCPIVAPVPGHKYYFMRMVKSLSETPATSGAVEWCSATSLRGRSVASGNVIQLNSNIGIWPEWSIRTAYIEVPKDYAVDTGEWVLRDYQAGGELCDDTFVLMDLTADFVANREPPYRWCRDFIRYFDTVYTIDRGSYEFIKLTNLLVTANPISVNTPFKFSGKAEHTIDYLFPSAILAGEIFAGEW